SHPCVRVGAVSPCGRCASALEAAKLRMLCNEVILMHVKNTKQAPSCTGNCARYGKCQCEQNAESGRRFLPTPEMSHLEKSA
ncbi:MAG: hypothetical protein ACLGRW_04065, partial [Acidobacteriota bacterium]